MGRIDIVDTVSMGIYNCEQGGYQFYDLEDCYSLKETDIWSIVMVFCFFCNRCQMSAEVRQIWDSVRPSSGH